MTYEQVKNAINRMLTRYELSAAKESQVREFIENSFDLSNPFSAENAATLQQTFSWSEQKIDSFNEIIAQGSNDGYMDLAGTLVGNTITLLDTLHSDIVIR